MTAKELEFIRRLVRTDNVFSDWLRGHPGILIDHESVTLDHADAELVRDYLTTRLATVGFDSDYRTNEDGVVLEILIDKFFFPSMD